jgi:hypothetical protein
MKNHISFALGRIGVIDSRFVSFLSSSFILVKTVYYSSTWASSWIVDYFINFQKLNSIFICMWFLYWMCVEYGILPEAYGC